MSFHPPAGDAAMILIGSGTGLAGLIAHLRDRAARGVRGAWLLFGERSRAHHYLHQAEIEAMLASGTLARVDLAFSRDQANRAYVQHLIDVAGSDFRAWVERGASIYVCGGLVDMAPAVDRSLRAILGDALVEDMLNGLRYRRDVY